MNVVFLLVAALSTVDTAMVDTAVADGDRLATDDDYRVVTDGTTTALKAGSKGSFHLAVEPKNGFHLSPETPLSADLESTDGVKLKVRKLSRKDLADGLWHVDFDAVAPGEQKITSDLVFFLCSDKLCQRMQAQHITTVKVAKAK